MDKLKYIKLENEDGSYSSSIPLAVDSDYVDVNGNTLTSELNNKANNSSINNLQNQISSLASGSPLVASSTSEMTDTTRVYVNTTDGHWYYYSNSIWNDGGVYQATEIADNSINYLKLDKMLKDVLNENSIIDKTSNIINGFYVNQAGAILANNNSAIIRTEVNEEDKILEIDITGLTLSTTLTLYGTYHNDNNTDYTGYFSLCPITYPAYRNYYTAFYNNYDTNKLYFKIHHHDTRKYCSITIKNDAFDITDRVKMYNYTNFFTEDNLKKRANLNEKIVTNFSSRDLLKDACITKGYVNDSPKIIVNAVSDNRGILMEMKDTQVLYGRKVNNTTSSSFFRADIFNSKFNYVRTVSFENASTISIDGMILNYITVDKDNEDDEKYIYLEKRYSNNYYEYYATDTLVDTFKITTIDDVEIKTQDINYGVKTWYAIGDSITEKNSRAQYNYIDYIMQELNIGCVNLGKSATGYKGMVANNTFIDRLSLITDYNIENDVITVMGSVNDVYGPDHEIGQLGDTTTDTLYGAIYTFFNTLFTRYPACRVGLITPIPYRYQTNNNKWEPYIQALIDTAKLFNVPYLLITNDCNLRPADASFLNEVYTSDVNGALDTDGIHPNSKGHRIIANKIKEFIMTL